MPYRATVQALREVWAGLDDLRRGARCAKRFDNGATSSATEPDRIPPTVRGQHDRNSMRDARNCFGREGEPPPRMFALPVRAVRIASRPRRYNDRRAARFPTLAVSRIEAENGRTGARAGKCVPRVSPALLCPEDAPRAARPVAYAVTWPGPDRGESGAHSGEGLPFVSPVCPPARFSGNC